MATLPLSWNDTLFSDNTNSGFVNMANPGTISNTSITKAGGASVAVGVHYTGGGSFTLNDVRMQGTEGVDIFSGGDVYINNTYIDTTGAAGDHADGIQVYAPGTKGNLTVTNTTIVSHTQNATAGVFVADDRLGGNYTFNNVVFDGGPFGLRINADAGPGNTYNVALKDVYFIQGSFGSAPFLIYVPPGYEGAELNITQWDNVRWATIVNGQLVPGDLIAPPQAVEGGTTPTAPAPTPPSAPVTVAPTIPAAPSGNSNFDGGPGNDKFSFNFKLTDAKVSFSGDHVIVDGPNGSHTVLTGFKTYLFTDGTVNNNDGDPSVDDLFYYSHNHDVWNAHVDADQHYHQFGWHEGRDPDALFDTNGYLAANPDVANAHVDPLVHYQQFGWREGRDPSPAFDTTEYLSHNPDVAAAHIDPLMHYLRFGADEGRQTFSHAILGSTGNDILKGTTASESFSGQGGQDTFVFAANFGNDVIRDFGAVGPSHDVLQFSKSVFDSFASVLSHASQAGQDVVISANSDTLLLKNAKLGDLDSSDFRFA